MRLIQNTELDTVEIVLEESKRVYGREEAPGVVLFRDTYTNKLCSVELLFYSEYPYVWNMSLELLGLGHLKEALKDLEEN